MSKVIQKLLSACATVAIAVAPVCIEANESLKVADDTPIVLQNQPIALTESLITLEHKATTSAQINFDSNGGLGTMDGSKVNLKGNPSKATYKLPVCTFIPPKGEEFKSWNVNGKSFNEGDSIDIFGNTTILAEWMKLKESVDSYKLKCDFNNVIMLEGNKTPTNNKDYKIKLGAVKGYYLPVAITVWIDGRELEYNKEFLYDNASGDIIIEKEKITGNVKVRADGIRKVISYDINFYSNGGSGTMMEREVNEGQRCVLPECYFVPPYNKVFYAWSINGVEYSPGETYKPSDDTEVYAIWEYEYYYRDRYWYDGYDVRYKYDPDYWYYYKGDIKFYTDNDSDVTKGESILFEVNEPILNYSDIIVDSVRVNSEYIDIDDYGRKLVLSKYFINSLSEGQHKLEIRFNNKTIKTTFNVKDYDVEYVYHVVETTPEYDSHNFIDVASNKWYYSDVMYISDQGIMNGLTRNEFGPDALATRAMIVQIIYNLESNYTLGKYQSEFSDVEYNQWYYNAVNWAVSNNICNGYQDGSFKPNSTITREQLATILCGYAQYKGYNTSARNYTGLFVDDTECGLWAIPAMNWATENGIIGGKEGSKLDPKGNATRAEIAAIIRRFIEKY